MRRREQMSEVEPPARLRAFDMAEWLPLVDASEYDAERHRNRRNGVAVGDPRVSLEAWVRGEAFAMWSRSRMAWQRQHGWPDGWGVTELLRDALRVKRATWGFPDPDDDGPPEAP